MFEIGEYVVSGNNGVCKVTDITNLHMNGVDKNRKYYILKPVYAESSTVYVPVDTLQVSMRKILSKEEAATLLDEIPTIQLLTIEDEKTVELQYKACMQSGSCGEVVKLLKTLYNRKKTRLEKGHKVTAVDSRYLKMAEDSLCGELAVALGITKSEAEEVIAGKMG